MGIKEMIKNKMKEKKEENEYRKKILAEVKEEVREELKQEIKKEMAEKYKAEVKDKILNKKGLKEKMTKFGDSMGFGEMKGLVTDDKINRMIGNSGDISKKKKPEAEEDNYTNKAIKKMLS
jgi:hypothetical protein